MKIESHLFLISILFCHGTNPALAGETSPANDYSGAPSATHAPQTNSSNTLIQQPTSTNSYGLNPSCTQSCTRFYGTAGLTMDAYQQQPRFNATVGGEHTVYHADSMTRETIESDIKIKGSQYRLFLIGELYNAIEKKQNAKVNAIAMELAPMMGYQDYRKYLNDVLQPRSN